jgi:hypothetical protein
MWTDDFVDGVRDGDWEVLGGGWESYMVGQVGIYLEVFAMAIPVYRLDHLSRLSTAFPALCPSGVYEDSLQMDVSRRAVLLGRKVKDDEYQSLTPKTNGGRSSDTLDEVEIFRDKVLAVAHEHAANVELDVIGLVFGLEELERHAGDHI